MSEPLRRIDGFQATSGLLGLLTGPVLLARGAPAGWSFLLIAAGIALLVTQWIIAFDIRFQAMDHTSLLLAAAAMVFVTIAVVYLTRAANDLPSLFPGHDGDSENFRVLPGVVILTVGVVLFGRAVTAAKPTRGIR
jgi:predicted membrane channel-forming protein YqfA (hemolysin III family)